MAGTKSRPTRARVTFSARWRSGLRPSTARSRRTPAGRSQPAPARVRASAAGRPSRAARPPSLSRCEDGGGLGQPAQLGQGLGQGGAGRVQAADDQPQSGADPGPADQGDDHGPTPDVASRDVVNPGFR